MCEKCAYTCFQGPDMPPNVILPSPEHVTTAHMFTWLFSHGTAGNIKHLMTPGQRPGDEPRAAPWDPPEELLWPPRPWAVLGPGPSIPTCPSLVAGMGWGPGHGPPARTHCRPRIPAGPHRSMAQRGPESGRLGGRTFSPCRAGITWDPRSMWSPGCVCAHACALVDHKHPCCSVGHRLGNTFRAIFFCKLHSSLGSRRAQGPHFTVEKTEVRVASPGQSSSWAAELTPAQHSRSRGDPSGPLAKSRGRQSHSLEEENGHRTQLPPVDLQPPRSRDPKVQGWSWEQTAQGPLSHSKNRGHHSPGDAAASCLVFWAVPMTQGPWGMKLPVEWGWQWPWLPTVALLGCCPQSQRLCRLNTCLPLAGWVTSDPSVSVSFPLCQWECSSTCLIQVFRD